MVCGQDLVTEAYRDLSEFTLSLTSYIAVLGTRKLSCIRFVQPGK